MIIVTTRKLALDPDPFAFGDKARELPTPGSDCSRPACCAALLLVRSCRARATPSDWRSAQPRSFPHCLCVRVLFRQILEKWYPTRELGDKKAVLLLVKTSKEGALSAGPGFSNALGDLVDSVSGDNIPFYAEQEKFNEAISTSLQRIEAKLKGKEDPGAPSVVAKQTGSNFKSKEQTEGKKGIYVTVVGGLLVRAIPPHPVPVYWGRLRGARHLTRPPPLSCRSSPSLCRWCSITVRRPPAL